MSSTHSPGCAGRKFCVSSLKQEKFGRPMAEQLVLLRVQLVLVFKQSPALWKKPYIRAGPAATLPC